MSAQKLRRHRGVVIGFADDLLPENFHDFMEIPHWPEVAADIVCGLGPARWGQIARFARTVQERVVLDMLAEGRSAAEAGEVLGPPLTATRVRQVATGVYQRVVGPQDPQGDMFGGDL